MTPQQQELFDRLFEEACEVAAADRPAWLAVHYDDPEVSAELESLLPHASGDGGFTTTIREAAAMAQPTPGSEQRIGAFRITGVLGEGGMGTVYEGVRDDEQFRQQTLTAYVGTNESTGCWK